MWKLYLIMSIYTFLVYGLDKYRSMHTPKNRMSEKHLHISEVLGGSIGGVLARIIFRHKIRKLKFLFLSYMILTIHIIAITYFLLSTQVDLRY